MKRFFLSSHASALLNSSRGAFAERIFMCFMVVSTRVIRKQEKVKYELMVSWKNPLFSDCGWRVVIYIPHNTHMQLLIEIFA